MSTPIRSADARITSALEAASDAFWLSIAQSFPEASSGDLPPCQQDAFDVAAREAVTAWVRGNAPDVFAPADIASLCRRIFDESGIATESNTDMDAAIEVMEAVPGAVARLHHSGGGTMHALAILSVGGVEYFVACHETCVEAFAEPPATMDEAWDRFVGNPVPAEPVLRIELPGGG